MHQGDIAYCIKCGASISGEDDRQDTKSGEKTDHDSWTDLLVTVEKPSRQSALKDKKTAEARRLETARKKGKAVPPGSGSGLLVYREYARALLLDEDPVTGAALWGRTALLLLMAMATLKCVFTPIPKVPFTLPFFHLVNLPFHEAGHVLFSPFGRFIAVAGGSLFQVMVPLVVMGVFLFSHRDIFGSSVAWWWAGQSIWDLTPYIYDARAGNMTLLGGITGRDNPDVHDWKNLLTWTGLLKYDHSIAKLAFFAGGFIMVLGVIWGGILVLRDFRAR